MPAETSVYAFFSSLIQYFFLSVLMQVHLLHLVFVKGKKLM